MRPSGRVTMNWSASWLELKPIHGVDGLYPRQPVEAALGASHMECLMI